MTRFSQEDLRKMLRENPDLGVDMMDGGQDSPPSIMGPEPKSEHELQVAQFDWLDQFAIMRWPDLKWAFAIPNGGHRHVSVGAKMKREGVRPGVPDIFVPISRGGHHGLYIENKYGKNKPSSEQADYLEYLEQAGYKVAVCTTLEMFQQVITEYMEYPMEGAAAMVYSNVAQRGYTIDKNGVEYEPRRLLARQALKLLEESCEVAALVQGISVNDEPLAGFITQFQSYIRHLFDADVPGEIRAEDISAIAGEMADVTVVLLVMQQLMNQQFEQSFDIMRGALEKSRRDIERGIRDVDG